MVYLEGDSDSEGHVSQVPKITPHSEIFLKGLLSSGGTEYTCPCNKKIYYSALVRIHSRIIRGEIQTLEESTCRLPYSLSITYQNSSAGPAQVAQLVTVWVQSLVRAHNQPINA